MPFLQRTPSSYTIAGPLCPLAALLAADVVLNEEPRRHVVVTAEGAVVSVTDTPVVTVAVPNGHGETGVVVE